MNKRNLSLLFSVSTILTVFIALPVSAEKTAGGTDADRRSTDVNICSIAGMNNMDNADFIIYFEAGRSGYTDNNIKWNLSKKGTLSFAGTGKLEINKDSDPLPWGDKHSVKKVIIGEGITATGAYLFNDYDNLESIKLPSTLKEIGNGSFCNLKKLSTVAIPEGVINIGADIVKDTPFFNDPDNWENGCLYKDGWLLAADDSVSSITVKDGTLGIAGGAFSDTKAYRITLPASLKYISDSAFGGCSADSVIIPGSVTDIRGNVFFDSEIKKIYIPLSVRSIDKSAFASFAPSDIYYEGSEDQWKSIYLDDGRPAITAEMHYGYTFPEIELEASEKDLVINTTSDGYGRIAVSISSESRELSDIQMFVSTFDGDLMTNTAKASAVISGSTATFTATLPLTNGRIFIWDGKQRPLANAAAIE